MTTFTPDFLTQLTAVLAHNYLPQASKRLKNQWQGDPAAAALQRCLHAGVIGFTSHLSTAVSHQPIPLPDLLLRFFQQDAVTIQLLPLLRVQPLSVPELEYLFQEAGYEPQTGAGLPFAAAVTAFEAAFLETAVLHPILHPAIPVRQGWAQTAIQQEMVKLMRQMAQALNQLTTQQVGIQAGHITAENVVSGTQIIYQWPATLPPHRSWEKQYLQTLAGSCNTLDLAAIDELYATDGKTAVHVTDVFTSLYLTQNGRPLRRLPHQTVAQAILHPQPAHDMRQEEEKGEPITAVSAIAALPHLVILGYPGGGKSTLVNYLAAHMAHRRLGYPATPLSGWEDQAALLPVRIILRHLAAHLPQHIPPGSTAGLVCDYLEHGLLKQWGCQEAMAELKHTLAETGGLVLFDGLDEVRENDADTRRSLLKQLIADFATAFPRCKIVVTCREYAYKDGDAWRLPERDFPVVDLSLFAPEQIQQFAHTWYQLTGPLKGWGDEQCRAEAENLYQASQQQPHLQELAQYPLLLTLMAQVHGRDGSLPQDRADLYDRAVNLLLAHWENRIERESGGERHTEPGLIAQLGVRTEALKGVLARVAFLVHEQQEGSQGRETRAADIPRLLLWDELNNLLKSYDQAQLVTDYVQHRAGLLQARSHATYTFPHRTFQEYLAALHIWKEANPGEALAERVKRDVAWWREVFLLAAGSNKNTPKNVSELVDWLLPVPPGKEITPAQAAWAMLAGQALWETHFLAHARLEQPDYPFTLTANRIKAWLQTAMLADTQLPAQQRAAAGQVLGRLVWPNGRLLDDRPGVGVVVQNGRKLPDIAWGQRVPAGTYPYQQKTVVISQPYQLARYPITYAQFQCFAEAEEFNDPRWWQGMAKEEEVYGKAYQLRQLSQQAFPFANHPRERVSWYQAIAFCRWLSDKLGLEIDLPHEQEWEVAARYPDGRSYPWGNEFGPEKANTAEGGIGSTTAVGLYPPNPLELYDLSGNVWEWCRNKYEQPKETAVDDSRDWRVLRGGAWYRSRNYARAAYRYGSLPGSRLDLIGFRVVVRRPPSH